MKSRFKIGDRVFLTALHSPGHITEYLGHGLYRVAIGSLSVKVAESELSQCTYNSEEIKPKQQTTRMKRSASVPSSLDLHGLTVDVAVRALEVWLNEAIVAGLTQIRVVHGLGSGRLQQATHDTLRRYNAVRAYRINDANPGVTDVYIG